MNSQRIGDVALPATEQEQARFLDQLDEGFQAASARMGEVVRDFRVAGTRVRLRFAGHALISTIVPGLAHPVDDMEAEPYCEICLWDSESSGVGVPPSPRPWLDFTERGNIWGFHSSRYRSAYQWGEGSVSVMDRQKRRAVYWVPSHKDLPVWVQASPLRGILHWCMELNGRQLVHAAAVGQDGNGVLLPGRGGSGKSSTSLACLLAGLDFLGDDYLALALDPEPRIYCLYSTAKLHPANATHYPELLRRCRTAYQPGFDKVVLFLEEAFAEQLRESLPLDLVLKPRISGAPETNLCAAKPVEIERALASETLAHLPHAGGHTLKFLERVSRDVPHATIRLGTERARIPAAIRAALKTRPAVEARNGHAAEKRPFVSLIVHFWEEDREELKAFATDMEGQGYSRTELLVILEGPACAMADEFATLPENVRFFCFQDPVVHTEAWNRGIREAFADFLVFLEPGHRLQPAALEALVDAAEREPQAAWIQGKALSERPENSSLSSLHGALIRRAAFQKCGLFHTERLLQGREPFRWLERAQENGLYGIAIGSVTLRIAAPNPMKSTAPFLKPDLSFLREELARRGEKKPE